jgi:hypothetical protein
MNFRVILQSAKKKKKSALFGSKEASSRVQAARQMPGSTHAGASDINHLGGLGHKS